MLADEANIRVALETTIGRHDANRALELVGLVGRPWVIAGRQTELGTRARVALALGGGEARYRGLALLSLGWADPQAGRESFAAAFELFQTATTAREAAYAKMSLGAAEGESGSVERGLELLESALAEFERLGDGYLISVTRHNIIETSSLRWPLAPAEARRLADRAREAIAEFQGTGTVYDEVMALDTLSHLLIEAGELDEAWSTALRAAALLRDTHTVYGLMPVISALARCAGQRGNAEEALLLAGAVRSVGRELGQSLPVRRVAALDAVVSACREALDEETAARATAAGEAMTVDAVLEYLETIE